MAEGTTIEATLALDGANPAAELILLGPYPVPLKVRETAAALHHDNKVLHNRVKLPKLQRAQPASVFPLPLYKPEDDEIILHSSLELDESRFVGLLDTSKNNSYPLLFRDEVRPDGR